MRLSGITADTGFLIGLERQKQRAMDLLGYAGARKLRISVPVLVALSGLNPDVNKEPDREQQRGHKDRE
jgi:hypothetical protein